MKKNNEDNCRREQDRQRNINGKIGIKERNTGKKPTKNKNKKQKKTKKTKNKTKKFPNKQGAQLAAVDASALNEYSAK